MQFLVLKCICSEPVSKYPDGLSIISFALRSYSELHVIIRMSQQFSSKQHSHIKQIRRPQKRRATILRE